MTRIGTNDVNLALSAHDLAILTDAANARSYFHDPAPIKERPTQGGGVDGNPMIGLEIRQDAARQFCLRSCFDWIIEEVTA